MLVGYANLFNIVSAFVHGSSFFEVQNFFLRTLQGLCDDAFRLVQTNPDMEILTMAWLCPIIFRTRLFSFLCPDQAMASHSTEIFLGLRQKVVLFFITSIKAYLLGSVSLFENFQDMTLLSELKDLRRQRDFARALVNSESEQAKKTEMV
jgi:hypothetical protein